MAKVMISYARDEHGGALAEWLVGKVRDAKHIVVWDRDLKNPASLPLWMGDQVATSVVVCVVTREYAKNFGGSDGPADRLGVRTESHAILMRLHEHRRSDDCPVIPVAAPDFPAAELPVALRGLWVTRVSVNDERGLEELLSRIASLDASAPETAVPPAGRVVGDLRSRLSRLDRAQPGTPEAIVAVKDWLEIRPDGYSLEFATGFDKAEKVAKAAGDLDLMRAVSSASLAALPPLHEALHDEMVLIARVFICGEAWCLQRTHKLDKAIEITRDGISIAEAVDDRRTVAFGKKSQGRLERLWADETDKPALAAERLRQSVDLLRDAHDLFVQVDGDESEEAGDCLSLEGRTRLVEFRKLRDDRALAAAETCVRAASDLLRSPSSKEYWDLEILRAELEWESGRMARALRSLSDVTATLSAAEGGDRSEILARAYRVRAAITGKPRSRTGNSQAIRDLASAEAIYRGLGQDHDAAGCWFRRMRLDEAARHHARVTSDDLDYLEREAPDPVLRRRAVDEWRRRALAPQTSSAAAKRARVTRWREILKDVRLKALRERR